MWLSLVQLIQQSIKCSTFICEYCWVNKCWNGMYTPTAINNLQVPVWFCILLLAVPWAGKGCADPCASLRQPGKPRKTGTSNPDHHPGCYIRTGQVENNKENILHKTSFYHRLHSGNALSDTRHRPSDSFIFFIQNLRKKENTWKFFRYTLSQWHVKSLPSQLVVRRKLKNRRP